MLNESFLKNRKQSCHCWRRAPYEGVVKLVSRRVLGPQLAETQPLVHVRKGAVSRIRQVQARFHSDAKRFLPMDKHLSIYLASLQGLRSSGVSGLSKTKGLLGGQSAQTQGPKVKCTFCSAFGFGHLARGEKKVGRTHEQVMYSGATSLRAWIIR